MAVPTRSWGSVTSRRTATGRHPADVLRLGFGLLILVWAAFAAASTEHSRLDVNLFRLINQLPDPAGPPLIGVMQLGALGAVPVVAIVCVLARRMRLARLVALGGAAAWLLAKVLSSMVAERPPDERIVRAWCCTAPLRRACRFLQRTSRSRPPWRRSRARTWAVRDGGPLAPGWHRRGRAGLCRCALPGRCDRRLRGWLGRRIDDPSRVVGAPRGSPDPHELAARLASKGSRSLGVVPLTRDGSTFRVETRRRNPLHVRVVDRDRREADWLYRAWRMVAFRDTGEDRGPRAAPTTRSNTRRLRSRWPHDADVPVPDVLWTARLTEGESVLVRKWVPGKGLAEVAQRSRPRSVPPGRRWSSCMEPASRTAAANVGGFVANKRWNRVYRVGPGAPPRQRSRPPARRRRAARIQQCGRRTRCRDQLRRENIRRRRARRCTRRRFSPSCSPARPGGAPREAWHARRAPFAARRARRAVDPALRASRLGCGPQSRSARARDCRPRAPPLTGRELPGGVARSSSRESGVGERRRRQCRIHLHHGRDRADGSLTTTAGARKNDARSTRVHVHEPARARRPGRARNQRSLPRTCRSATLTRRHDARSRCRGRLHRPSRVARDTHPARRCANASQAPAGARFRRLLAGRRVHHRQPLDCRCLVLAASSPRRSSTASGRTRATCARYWNIRLGASCSSAVPRESPPRRHSCSSRASKPSESTLQCSPCSLSSSSGPPSPPPHPHPAASEPSKRPSSPDSRKSES